MHTANDTNIDRMLYPGIRSRHNLSLPPRDVSSLVSRFRVSYVVSHPCATSMWVYVVVVSSCNQMPRKNIHNRIVWYRLAVAQTCWFRSDTEKRSKPRCPSFCIFVFRALIPSFGRSVVPSRISLSVDHFFPLTHPCGIHDDVDIPPTPMSQNKKPNTSRRTE